MVDLKSKGYALLGMILIVLFIASLVMVYKVYADTKSQVLGAALISPAPSASFQAPSEAPGVFSYNPPKIPVKKIVCNFFGRGFHHRCFR